jgi:hypothetical protein
VAAVVLGEPSVERSSVSAAARDFGATYWNSSLVREEYPGLLARGFRAAGRHGIGFFSVFREQARGQLV